MTGKTELDRRCEAAHKLMGVVIESLKDDEGDGCDDRIRLLAEAANEIDIGRRFANDTVAALFRIHEERTTADKAVRRVKWYL